MALPFPADEDEFGLELSDAPPDHLLIKIQSFSKLWIHGVERHESSHIIIAGNYKWKLIIYPNGRKCENAGYISVYVSVAETDSLPEGWEIHANLRIFLHNQISDKYLCFRGKARRFDAMNLKWGFSMSKRIWADESSGYLVDDECAFGAEIFVTKPKQAVECLSLHDWSICNFSKLVDVWSSQVFLAGGLRWKIMLYPNVVMDLYGNYISIGLQCVESKSSASNSNKEVKVDFSIRIKSQVKDNDLYDSVKSYWFTSDADDLRFDFCRAAFHDPNQGFVVNDCCVLQTQISVLDVVYTPKPEDLP